MRRRDFVAGLGGVVALGAAGWYAVAGNGAGNVAAGDDETGVEPVTVETLDAPHSDAGTMTVPVPGSVTVVDVFATWCAGCDDQLRSLARAREQVDGSVRFVSVTNEAIGGGLTRDDIREFWREHAGRWPVGLDDEGKLTTRLEARNLPHTAVTDPSGRVVYAEQGVTSPDAVVSAIQQARTR
jgi:thiol-disulfide isomerase/thioredoxin